MKRLIILLAVFFTFSFLSAVEPSNTEVELSIALVPDYLINVNTVTVSENDDTIPSPLDENGIVLSYDDESFVLESTAENDYYISYIFKEYKACVLSAALDGPLHTADASSDYDRIPFEVRITRETDDITLSSSDTAFKEILRISQGTTKVADRVQGSFAIQVNPSTEAGNSLKDKKAAQYTAYLKLKVEEI